MLSSKVLVVSLIVVALPLHAFEPDPREEMKGQISLIYTCASLYKSQTAHFESGDLLESYAEELGHSIDLTESEQFELLVNADYMAKSLVSQGDIPIEMAMLCGNILGEVQSIQ
jgi:hypothetical protein